MNSIKFDGRHIRIDDDVCRVVRRHPELPCMIIDHPQGYTIEMPLEEFRLAIAQGRVSSGLDEDFRNNFVTPSQRLDHEFRKAVVTKVAAFRSDGHSWETAREMCRGDLAGDPRFREIVRRFPSVRTLQNWRSTFLRKGQNNLRDARDKSGNRTSRHSQIFEDVVLDMLEESFLTSDRMSVTQLARSAGHRYREICQREGIAPKDHGRKVVESIVSSLPHSDVVKLRLGSELARKALLQAGRFQSINHPLDRVEVDSTQADIFVIIDDEGALARPWVTIAIDVATGLIMGMTVSLESPTSLRTVRTLVEAMRPKEEDFFERHQIENRFQAYGGLLTVVADQGSENSGELISRLIEASGAEFQKTIPKHPEKKPFIERLMSTFSVFVTQLPGATKTNAIPARVRTSKAQDEARLSFEDFVSCVQKWRYDVYAQTPRRRVQSPLKKSESPVASWKRMIEVAFVPEPPSARELNTMLFSRREKRKLQHYGIEVNRIQYWSSELGEYFHNYRNRNVEVWINPIDIREIAVATPEFMEPIFVGAKDPDMPALTIDELRRILKEVQPAKGDFVSAQAALNAILGGQHHKGTKASGKMAKSKDKARQMRRKKEIAEKGRGTSSVEQIAVGANVAELPMSLPDDLAPMTKRGR